LHLATKLLSAKDIPRIIATVSRGLSGENFEGFVIKYRDKILDIKPLSIIAQSGGGAIIRDITEVTYSKELLEKSEREYKLVVENAIEAIFVIQEDKIVFSNTTLHNIMGMSAEELKKINFVDFIDPETRESAIENYYLRLSGEFLPPMVHKIFVREN
jgi:PAS domain-containing protein